MSNEKKERGLVDMDGTIAAFNEAMEEALKGLLAPGEEPRLTAEDEENFAYMKARRRLVKSQPGWWLNLKPIERGFRIVAMMEELNFKISVLTRGPKPHPLAWAEKVQWVQKYLPGRRTIVMDDEKALVYGRVLMDDWIPYIEPWLKVRKRGLVILPDQPWNAGFEHERVVRHTGLNDDEVRARLIEAKVRVKSDP